jgi:WD40 repeat protein
VPGHTLLRRIGGGAYGEVWLARETAGAWRAVKVVRRAQFDHARPFDREIAGLEKFSPVSRLHESQVAIHTFGRDDAAGWFFYAMELADDVATGQAIEPASYTPRTLASELKTHGRLPAAESLRLVLALCTALEHLHRHNLIHRDIKPSNIIFVGGKPKLADIGLVTGVDEQVSFVGTEGYVPPEGPGTPRGDLFSLGRVLYQLHTGRPATDFPLLPTVLEKSDSSLVERELNLVILKAAAEEPEERHADAAELRAELLLLQSGRSLQRLRAIERNLAWLRRFGLAAALVAIAAITALVVVVRSNRQVRAEKAAAQKRTAEALLAEARAVRVSGLAGRRAEALQAIAAAARLAPSRALRDEALASLAVIDFGEEQPGLPHPPRAVEKLLGDPSRVQFSPDFTRVAWCHGSDEILIADASDGREIMRLPGRGASLLGVAWSLDGRFVAGAFHGETLVWRLGEAEPLLAAPAAREPFSSAPPVSFSAAGTQLARLEAGEVILHALPGGAETARLVPLENARGVLLHPTQPWVAVWSPVELIIWDFAASRVVNRYMLPSEVSLAQWSPDGRVLAFGLLGRIIHVADVTRPEAKGARQMLFGHTDRPLHLAFSPDGALLLSTARDGNTRLWNALTGACLASTYRGLGLGFSPDGRRIAFSRPQQLGLWTLVDGAPGYRSLSGRLRMKLMGSVDFSPDSRWLAAAARDDDGLWLWNLASGQIALEGLGQGVKRRWLRFLPDGHSLLTLGNDGVVRWPFQVVPAPDLGLPETLDLPLEKDPSEAAALSHDGRALVAKTGNTRGWLAGLAKAGAPENFSSHSTRIGSVALHPDGRTLAIGSGGGGPSLVLDLAARSAVRALLPTGDANVAFSPDGRWLARFGEMDCEIYDAQTFNRIHRLPREHLERRPGAMAFSADGRYFAYLSARGVVELHAAATLEPLARLTLPSDAYANCLRFSPDGDYLAAYESSELHLFHLPTLRRELATMGLDW